MRAGLGRTRNTTQGDRKEALAEAGWLEENSELKRTRGPARETEDADAFGLYHDLHGNVRE